MILNLISKEIYESAADFFKRKEPARFFAETEGESYNEEKHGDAQEVICDYFDRLDGKYHIEFNALSGGFEVFELKD